eukprot:2098328-Rhodomonas_salina.2
MQGLVLPSTLPVSVRCNDTAAEAPVHHTRPHERVLILDVWFHSGDAMTLQQKHLSSILDLIQQYLPGIRRVSSYCLPRNVRPKTVLPPSFPHPVIKHAIQSSSVSVSPLPLIQSSHILSDHHGIFYPIIIDRIIIQCYPPCSDPIIQCHPPSIPHPIFEYSTQSSRIIE